MPKLTVGMPLYNDAEKLPKVIESVLNQSFTDFEFIINDNCSTDGSYEIAQKYASQDRRIKLFRNRINLGAYINFMKIHKMPKSEFFCQKSSDDVIAPTYFEELINLLQTDKNAVLAYSNADNTNCSLSSIIDDDPLERGRQGVKLFTFGHVFYGICRSYLFDEMQLPLRLQHNDHMLFLDCCLQGKILYLDKVLYFRNVIENRKRESYAELCGAKSSSDFPNIGWLEMLVGHIRVIQNSEKVKNKEEYSKDIAKIIYDKYGKSLFINEYKSLCKYSKLLRKNKKENYYWKVTEQINFMKEVKTCLNYIPSFKYDYLKEYKVTLYEIMHIN